MTELLKRFATSIILLPLLIVCFYLSGEILILFLFFFLALCVYEIFINSKNIIFNLVSSFIVLVAFYSAYFLRNENDNSVLILVWCFLTTFFSDIGGYVFGKTFKGKKLTKISPNKTYSGAFGSFVFSVISLPILNSYQDTLINLNLIDFYEYKNFYHLLCFMSLICQCGDLLVSYYKRALNIKDISNFLPGHGGVLDRIDGLIFVLIFGYIFSSIVF
jgi:phosphatidate cytidylyltransferase